MSYYYYHYQLPIISLFPRVTRGPVKGVTINNASDYLVNSKLSSIN